MTTTVSKFRSRFPEFCDEDEIENARIKMFISDTELLHIGADEKRWCGKYDIAQEYLVAHLLYNSIKTEVGDGSASVGSIASKSAGGVSVSRAVVAKDRSDADNFYSNSAYGMQFLTIRNSCFVGALSGD